MQVEPLEIQWKTFSEELPIRDVWIYVTPPDGGYLRAYETTLMANTNNGDEHINDGYHFFPFATYQISEKQHELEMVLPWRHQNKGGLNGRRTLYMSLFSIRNSKQSILSTKLSNRVIRENSISDLITLIQRV